MTPKERLTAALRAKGSVFPEIIAALIIDADPDIVSDIEAGEALRLLQASLHPTDFLNILSPNTLDTTWYIDAQCAAQEGDTFVQTANALRAAVTVE